MLPNLYSIAKDQKPRLPHELLPPGEKIALSRGLCGGCGRIIQVYDLFWWTNETPPVPICEECIC